MPRPPLSPVVLVSMAVLLPGAPAQAPPTLAFPPIAPGAARLAQTIGGLDGPAFATAAGDAAGMLAVACEGGGIHCWHKDVLLGVRSGGGTPHVLRGHQGPVVALAWSGGPLLASAGDDRRVLLWDLAAGKVARTLSSPGPVRALAMSPDGKRLAVAGDDAAVRLYDPATGKPGLTLTGHADWVLCLAFSPDGRVLASGGHDGTARLWDAATGKALFTISARLPPPPKTPVEPAPSVLAVAFSPDGKTLALGAADGQVYLAGTADGKVARALTGHTSAVTALAFHPGGAVLASASKDGTARLWAPANGQLFKALEGHEAWVQSVAFLAQGTRLATAGADATVRLWDLTQPR